MTLIVRNATSQEISNAEGREYSQLEIRSMNTHLEVCLTSKVGGTSVYLTRNTVLTLISKLSAWVQGVQSEAPAIEGSL